MSARTDSVDTGSRARELKSVTRALKRNPQNLRILFACTMAAVVTVFEPGYLTLSTSVIQAGLRAPNSPAPLAFATAFLVLALITLLAGTSADLFGRRLLLVLGLAGLTVSNVLAMVWLDTPRLFVFADLANAVCAVIVLPAAIALVTVAFEPGLRPIAYGILFGIQGTALVVGALLIPVLGDVWEGRATFVPVLVLGIIALVMVRRQVPESRAPQSLRRRSVLLNLVLVAGLFAVLFLVLTNGIRTGESMVALALSLLLLLVAVVMRALARRSRHFTGIEIYGGRDLGLAVFAGMMLMFAQASFFYQSYTFFIDVQEVGAVEAALRYVPYVLGAMAAGVSVGRLAPRFGARLLLVFSFGMTGAALLGLSGLTADSPFSEMILPITLLGFAAGLGGPARTTVVMGASPAGLVNSSSAVNTAAGQGGYALGVIVSSVLVTRHADGLFVDALSAAGVPASIVANVTSGLESTIVRLMVAPYPELPPAIAALTGISYADSFTSGMTRMFLMVAIATFLTALVIFVGMRRGLRILIAEPMGLDTSPTDATRAAPPAQRFPGD